MRSPSRRGPRQRFNIDNLTRDLNELVAIGLLTEHDGNYRANDQILLNLLPLVVVDQPAERLPSS